LNRTPLNAAPLKATQSRRGLLAKLIGVAGPVATIVILATGVVRTQGARAGAIPIPKVSGPIPVTADSHPFLAATNDLPLIDLPRSGYVEEEFLIGGTANVYDWAQDGTLSIRTPDAAYGTRILVRRPANPSRFSGAVVVEPLFPARGWDWSMMWGYSHDYLLEHGDAWVGMTMPAAVAGLRKFNPTRYASLAFGNPTPGAPCAGAPNNAADTEDGLRWDMITQVGALLKSDVAGRPLTGFRVEALYLTSQGGDLTTYINAIQARATLGNGRPVYDGYVAKAPFNLARINRCAAAPAQNDPRQVVRNAGVPVIAVAAQGEVLTTYPGRRPDSDEPRDRYRLYEIAGAGHIDRSAYVGFPSMPDQAGAGNAQGTPAWPFAARCDPEIPLMDTPIMTTAFNTAFARLDEWVRKGVAAPRASRIELKDPGTAQTSIVTDQFGHGVGGFRTPYVEVPVAAYATNSPGPGTCREMGHKTPFDPARLEALYGGHKGYTDKVTDAVDRLVKERWLTSGDARRITAELIQPLSPKP
jgi:hypothetical protein